MKHCWFYLVACAILSSAFAFAQQPANDSSNTLMFENGTITNGVYSNECLGFSLPILAGWASADGIMGPDRKATHNGRALQLLAVHPLGEKPPGPFVALTALDGQTGTAEDFVSSNVHSQIKSRPKEAELIRDASAISYGGQQFFRADYKVTLPSDPKALSGPLYVAYIYTKFRGFVIGETIMADSPAALDNAANSLRSISFQDDRINPNCAMGSEAGSSVNAAPGSGPNTPQSNSPSPQRVRIDQKVSTGLLIRKVVPIYSEFARQAGIQGSVVLQALIDKNGNIEDLTLVSGHPVLAPAATKAVKQWKYKPYLLNGQAVKVETQIVVNFSLSGR